MGHDGVAEESHRAVPLGDDVGDVAAWIAAHPLDEELAQAVVDDGYGDGTAKEVCPAVDRCGVRPEVEPAATFDL